jgi:hypothetical protein
MVRSGGTYMCTCMFNYLLGQLGMGTTITRNETKRSDEISKANPHKAILWFQEHVILYSQRNVIIQRWPLYSIYCNGSYAGFRPDCSLGNCSDDPSHNHFSTDWNQICVVYSLTYGEAPISNVSTFGVM